ncbi:MAG: M48 family metallopeptidase [Thermodesulfobacteriota bacterium]
MAEETSTGRTTLEKAAAYQKTKRRLALVEFGLLSAYLVAALAWGWTFFLRDLAYRAGGGPAVWVLIYFLVGGVVFELATLPLTVFSGYVIERRYGLMRQSLRAWTWDLVKAQLVGLVLGLVAVETLYLLFRRAGAAWWLWAGVIFALFFVVLAQVTPVVILPLFFKFKKLPEGGLTDRLMLLCRRAGTPVLGVYEWGLAAKSARANAALVGWGPTRRVVLSDSLLERFTPSEVEVVLAHELGHHRKGHLWWLLALQTVLTFVAFYLAGRVFAALGPRLGLGHLADPTGLPLLVLTFLGLGLLTYPWLNAFSRRLERQADLYALELTGLTGSFISAMERLAAMNLVEIEPNRVIEFLFHSHPSPGRRIQAAKDFRGLGTAAADALH